MISNKFVYSVMAGLITFLLLVLLVFPSLDIEAKNDSFSYETMLFNQKKVTTVQLEINEDDWNDILENPMKEEYKEATVTINGKRIKGVGIRTKGNSSLFSVANSDSDRYSLKIDFDHYDSSQSYYGLKKLNLNNNFSDTTQMKEYVSYEILDSMGLPTPEHSYMYVTVNGEDYGLMHGVEQVDETFLAKNFGSNNGYLFKPDGTGSDLNYISSNFDDYSGLNPKTNESSIEKSKIIDMIETINNGGNIEEYIDVDNMLRYFAATTALVSMDSYQGSFKHNYYLYEDEGKFSIIPWDYNMAFGGFGVGEMGEMMNPDAMENMKPPGDGKMPDEIDGKKMQDAFTNQEIMVEESINFDIYNPVSGASLEDRPLLNVLLSNEKYVKKYEEYLEEISTKYFTEENVSKITKQVAATILTYVEADPSKFGTTEEFLEGVSGENSLSAFAGARSDSILKQLSGELVIDKEDEAALNKKSNETSDEMKPPNGVPGGGKPPEGAEQAKLPEGMGMGQMDNANPKASMQNWLFTLGSLFILLIFIIVVGKFNRRGGFKS